MIRQVVQLHGEVDVLDLEAVGQLYLDGGEVEDALDGHLGEAIGGVLGRLSGRTDHAQVGLHLLAHRHDLGHSVDQKPRGELAPDLHGVGVKGRHEAVALLGEVLVGDERATQVAHAHDGHPPFLVQAQDLAYVEQ